MPADLRIPPLAAREPLAAGGAAGAKFYFVENLRPEATSGKLETGPFPLATRLRATFWQADKGGKLKFSLPVEQAGRVSIHLVAVHRPDGAKVRVFLDGQPLAVEDGGEEVALRTAHVPRVLNVHFKPIELQAGQREVVLECVEAGPVGLDYVWIRKQ
jgi:hypothetical protein